MSESLIINARHRLRWHQRLASDASTAAIWGGWLWLWTPLIQASTSLGQLGRTGPALMKLVGNCAALDFQHSLMALVGTSGTLLVWSKLPARKVRRAPVLSVRDYARHFDLPERQLHAAFRSSICVVHHDDDGRIVDVECREAAGQPQALAG